MDTALPHLRAAIFSTIVRARAKGNRRSTQKQGGKGLSDSPAAPHRDRLFRVISLISFPAARTRYFFHGSLFLSLFLFALFLFSLLFWPPCPPVSSPPFEAFPSFLPAVPVPALAASLFFLFLFLRTSPFCPGA